MKTKIHELDKFPLSIRNGSYGGNSGGKESILINDKFWIIKYPKSTKGMSRIGTLSYTTSPLSEYLGSQIYHILGYEVHDTILGIRNSKVVVACKDFCVNRGDLVEFRELKNTYNEELNMKLEESFSSTGSSHFVNLNEIMLHLEYNPLLKNVEGIKERFWDCVVIDGLINNNDRNSGNWGLIINDKGTRLAPVFDNGASFSAKVSEDRLKNRLLNKQSMIDAINGNTTSYSIDGEKNIFFKDLILMDIKDLQEALIRVVPKIIEHQADIKALFESLPSRYQSYEIITETRKEEYYRELLMRLDDYIHPAYHKAREKLCKNLPQKGIRERADDALKKMENNKPSFLKESEKMR